MANGLASSFAWRVACLRGIETTADGPRAVVALSAHQYLRLPLAAGEVADWQARLGERVWVNLEAQPMRLQADQASGATHA